MKYSCEGFLSETISRQPTPNGVRAAIDFFAKEGGQDFFEGLTFFFEKGERVLTSFEKKGSPDDKVEFLGVVVASPLISDAIEGAKGVAIHFCTDEFSDADFGKFMSWQSSQKNLILSVEKEPEGDR